MNENGCVFATSIPFFGTDIYSFNFFFNTVSQPYPGTLTAQLNEAQPTKNNHSVFL